MIDGSQVADRKAGPRPDADGLLQNGVGPWGVIFVSITSMAPAAGVAFSISIGATFAGKALPASVILGLIACLCTASSMGQLGKHLPSAGGMFAYIAAGVSTKVGFLAGWGFNLAYGVVIPFLALLFGELLAGTLQSHFGWAYEVWWVVGAIVLLVVACVLNYLSVKVTARSTLILGCLELAVVIALSVTLIVDAGKSNSLSLFSPASATVTGYTGASGLFAGAVYAILGFVGFDAAVTLGEESEDPKRNIGRGVLGATLVVGLFYLLSTYASDAYFGPGRFLHFSEAGGGNPWNLLATEVWGNGWIVLFLALLNSALGCAIGGGAAAARSLYAMGRIRVLPRALGATHRRHKTPHNAILVVYGAGVALAVTLGEVYGPAKAFGLLGTVTSGAVIPIYALVNLACTGFYLRSDSVRFNWWWHGVVPLMGFALFVPAWFTALGLRVFGFISPLASPLNAAGYVVGGWYALGLVLLVYFAVRRPERIRATARVFVGEPEA